ncbi:MAG: PAS domain-containing sensor histidine kinase [Desulfobacteraceae bacterium]|nr:MAG: PAS domain-containing sensor histidine kinase [Desulfobacteraceae bacterium]
MKKTITSATQKEISCRITRTVLMYVRENNGQSLGNLLEGLELDEKYLLDTHHWVSHGFLQKLYHRMIDLLNDPDAVYHMTLASGRFQSLGILDRIIRLLGSPKLIYSQAPKYNKFLKLNGNVFIHEISDTSVILEDRYIDGLQKTRLDCDYTRGILAGIPTIYGLPLAQVEELKCQVAKEKYGWRKWPDQPEQGCSGCFYRVTWASNKIPLSRRFFFRRAALRRSVDDLVKANQLVQAKYDEVKTLLGELEDKNRQLQDSQAVLEHQQQELAASERKYRNLFEHGSDLICIHDLEGRLLDTNIEYKTEYGWKKSDLVGQNIGDLIPEPYRQSFEEYLVRVVEQTEDDGYLKAYTKAGRKVILEYRNKLIYDEQDRPVAVQGAARDVTNRIYAEKALQESQEKYKGLVQYAPTGIYEFDMQSLRFTSVNDVMCEYTGYSREEFLALNPYDIICEESRDTLTDLVENVFTNTPRELSVEYKIKGKNQRELWVLTNARFFYEDGVPKRAMTVVHDLTDIRKAEEERRRLESQLQHAQKMEAIGTLAGGIAHDFNNILSGILGYCALLERSLENPEKAKTQVGRIHQGAVRAAELVQQILAFSRNTEYEKKPLILKPLVKEAMKLLRPSIPSTIDIIEDLASKSRALADPAKVLQLILNLCTNAYQSMSDSGGTLRISLIDVVLTDSQALTLQVVSGPYIKLEVTDTGYGIPNDILERIFDPYFTTKEIGKGTGMGLSMVYAIVREHHGAVYVKSEVDKGSKFEVYLPVTQSTPGGTNGDEQPARAPAAGNERIMVVDDEKSILESTRELLNDYGYQVTCFENGRQAADAFADDPYGYDLVLTDLTMPGMTGDALAREILTHRNDLPVILCSGYNETITGEHTERAGITRFINKPLIDQPLPDIIRDVLDGFK